MIKKIQETSVYLHRPESFIKEILKPAAKYLNCECCGVAQIGDFHFDRRAITYNYPMKFFYHLINNPNLYDYFEYTRHPEAPKEGFFSITNSDISEKEFKKSKVYLERYVPSNIYHGAQTTFFDFRKKVHGATGFLRKKDKVFTEAEKQKMNIVSPYIYFAYRKYMMLAGSNLFSYDNLEKNYINGIVISNSKGKIKYINENAKYILEENKCEAEKGTPIPEPMSEEIEKLENIAMGKARDLFFMKDIFSICNENRFTCVKIDGDYTGGLPLKEDDYLFIIDVEKTSVKYFFSLTKREREILMHIAMGKQDKEIAATLDISIKTVQNHMEKIYRKLKVTNRTEASDLARRIGIY